MKTGAVYIRVSTDKQEELSPDAQKRLILDYAKNNEIIVSEDCIFRDIGISGTKSENRPQFNRMIAEAKSKEHPFDVILVWKFSRFARNQEESIVYKRLLRKNNVEVVSISEPLPEGFVGELVERIFEWMDEYYSINLSGEVMRGMTQKVLNGGYLGYQPMGYEKANGGVPEINKEDAKIVQLIFNKFVEEGYGISSVSKYLNDNGIYTRNGNKWERRTIEYILRNPFYIGKIRWNYGTHKDGRKTNPEEDWIIVDGSHKPIIDKDLFEKAQEKLNQIKRPSGRRGRIPMQHWLSGILRCERCGGSINYHKAIERRGQSAYFTCRNYHNSACKFTQYTTVQAMEKKFFEGLIDSIENESYEISKSGSNIIELEKDYLQESLKELEKKEERIKAAYRDGIDTIEEYKTNKAILLSEKEKILIKMENRKPDKTEKLSLKKYYDIIDILKSESFSIDQKNETLKLVCKKIVYDKKKDIMDFYLYE